MSRLRWFDQRRSWKHRHYGYGLYVGYLVASFVVRPLPLPRSVAIALSVGLLIAAGSGLAAMYRHHGRLCERCVEEMPLNPQETASKRRSLLRLYHASVVLAVFNVSVMAVFLLALTREWTALEIVAFEVILVTSLAAIVSQRSHSRLQPWCPWCRHGGRGPREVQGDPEPTAGHGRPLPAMG
ncbi:hypothetical protein [Streptomyces marianii]|uniref:Uncharacterized protein n=1 Tax=Streptomyces marianii TaxID=1817406 RepID=A0A5R9DWJ0_9ACTN|nr:hypothetical protein [Streptomyces marianii]TLQ39242.1 hypothetical protein FEF34_38235 [Streptomyces marianii]